MGAYVVVALLLLLLPGVLLIERLLRDRLIEARLASLVPTMQAMTLGLEERVAAAEGRIRRYADVMGREAPAVDPARLRQFDQLVARGPDGAWRSRRDRFDPEREAGIFIPNTVTPSARLRTLLMQAKEITEQFGAGTLDPRYADAWLYPAEGGEAMYVPDQPGFIYEELPGEDYRTSQFFLPVTPDSNPAGVPRWTEPYFSRRTNAWYVSIIAPFRRAGRFAGVVGQDLSLEELLDYSARTPFEAGGRFLVLGATGTVLVADGVTVRTPGRSGGLHLRDLPDPALRTALGALLDERIPAREVRRIGLPSAHLLASRIAGTGWLAVSVVPVEALAGPIRGPLRLMRGTLVGGFGLLLGVLLWTIGREMRARERVVDGLRRSEERFLRLFQLSPDGVTLTRLRDGVFLLANDRFAAMSGWSPGELIGRPASAFQLWGIPEDRAKVMAELESAGGVAGFSSALRRRDGQLLEVEVAARRIEVDGEPCMLAIQRDVQEQRILARQLAQAQKLEAVGRLAGGIAHDFNNVVTAILGHAQLARDALPPGTDAHEDLEQIVRASGRAAELTRHLLAFSRHQVVQPRLIDLNHLLEEAHKLLERLIGAHVRLVMLPAPEPAHVRVDPGQLEQVVMNLVVNARDAMPAGGVLTLRVGVEPSTVTLEVEDTGLGMAPEVQSRIFEPFFTTKAQGQGTGLGLAMCYGIVQQAGGTIEVASAPGAGASFLVRLPRVEAPAVPQRLATPPEPPGLPRGSETVLLAEDEPQVRDVAARALRALGYQVLEAADGIAALELARERKEPIQLLVTDVVMPRLGGPALAERLRAEMPGLRVLYLSGYTADTEDLERALRLGGAFLHKPYALADLAREVRRSLDQPG